LHDNWPIGTNLLTAVQARAMLEYVLNWTAGAPSAQQPLDGPANNAGVATGSRNGPPSESVTRGNPPSILEQPGSAVQGEWDAQAYAAMRGDLETWKQRALTAEADIGRLYLEFSAQNGPALMGEPVLPSFHDTFKRGCHSPDPKYTPATPPPASQSAPSDGGGPEPGEPEPPPSTPAQHYLASVNGAASQEWQDGFNEASRLAAPTPEQR
jgi:hypothetical protein